MLVRGTVIRVCVRVRMGGSGPELVSCAGPLETSLR
jgi:hypothetical protein